MLLEFLGQRLGRLVACAQNHVCVNRVALDLVGQADGRSLRDCLVADQRTLDLSRAQPVARHLDHIVHAADDPVVAVLVARALSPVK
jgi:hypothetical protein